MGQTLDSRRLSRKTALMAIVTQFAAAICLNVFAFAVEPAAAEEGQRDDSDGAISQYGFRETGETRLCLTFTKLDAIVQIDIGEFLFVNEGKHYLNVTQSDCPFTPGRESSAKFILKTGLICKNTTMYIDGN